MPKLTKRQEYLATLEEKKYTVSEAVEFLKSGPKSNFEESVDVAINLGIDASKSDQTVRSATSLPAGTGKNKINKQNINAHKLLGIILNILYFILKLIYFFL